jgi:hypothetical protein
MRRESNGPVERDQFLLPGGTVKPWQGADRTTHCWAFFEQAITYLGNLND